MSENLNEVTDTVTFVHLDKFTCASQLKFSALKYIFPWDKLCYVYNTIVKI